MKNQDSFRNSELDRAKPKRHIFRALVNDNLKRHRSDIGLVEDRTSSVTIVRIIVGLLLVHLIIIGGVLLRGHMMKEGGAGLNSPMAITPPPTAPPAAPQIQAPMEDVLPQPTAPAVEKPIIASNHITQATADTAEEDAVDPDEEPTIVTPPTVAATPVAPAAPAAPVAPVEPVAAAPAAPAAAAQPIQHLVAPGDGWLRIAAQYGTTEAALKAANPQAARANLRVGMVLVVPQKDEAAAAAAAARKQAAAQPAAPKVYTVRSGETLSRIAKKTHVSVQTLMEINGIKNANRIQPGMQLRLSR